MYVSGNPIRLTDRNGQQGDDFDSWIGSTEVPSPEERDWQFGELLSHQEQYPSVEERLGLSPSEKASGDYSREISGYQSMLKQAGAYSGEITGVWDEATEGAYRALMKTEAGRGAADLWSQLGKLYEKYDPSSGVSQEEFSAEVLNIKSAITNTWIKNFNVKGSKEPDYVGGHLCWDWALGFKEAIDLLQLSHWTVDVRMAYEETRTEERRSVHFYAELHAFGRTSSAASSVAIDDAWFGTQLRRGLPQYVWDVPFPPPGSGFAPGTFHNPRPTRVQPVTPYDPSGKSHQPQLKYPNVPVQIPRYND